MSKVFNIITINKRIYNISNIFPDQLIVVCDLDTFVRSINEQGTIISLATLQNQDAGRNGSSKEQVARQLNDAVNELLSIRYWRIFFSAPPRYMMLGKQTIVTVPLVESPDSECMINARSAFYFGVSTLAGEKRVVFIKTGLSSPPTWLGKGDLKR